MFTLTVLARLAIRPAQALLLAAGLVQLGACAAVTRQVPVPAILAEPPPPAARSASLPQPEKEIAPAPPAPLPAQVAAAEPMPAPNLAPTRHDVFVDRFDSIDPQRWYVHDRGPGGSYTVNDFRPSQTDVTASGLRLTMQKNRRGASSAYSAADLSAVKGRTSGYVEARVKAASGSGVNTGVFTYGRSGGNDTWNEIDFEILGQNTNTVELTLHVGGKTVNKRYTLGFDSSKSFHTYAIAWERGRVRWFIDNKLVHEVKGGIANGLVREQWLHVNLWGTEELWQWMGRLDPARDIWTAEVSCAAMADRYEGKSLCARPAAEGKKTAAPAVATATPGPVAATPAQVAVRGKQQAAPESAPAMPRIVHEAPGRAPVAATTVAPAQAMPSTPAGTPLVKLTPSVAPPVTPPPAESDEADQLEGSPSRR